MFAEIVSPVVDVVNVARSNREAADVAHRESSVAWRALRPVARIYVGAVIAFGALAVVLAAPRIAEGDAALFTALTVLSLITSFAKINVPVTRGGSTLTVCYVVDFTTLLLLGQPAATMTAAAGVWSQCTFRRRQHAPEYQTWFSVGALALTVQAAGSIYTWLGGHHGLPRTFAHVEALMAAEAVHFLMNSMLVAGAVALSAEQSPLRTWASSYAWIWPGHFLGFSLAVVAAAGIGQSTFWLIPFAMSLLALTYGNFKAYAVRFTDSVTDSLTELPNRRYVQSHVPQELARAERGGTPLTLMIVDLDNFKSINDGYGHQAGDLALQQVAQQLQRSVRSYDICARYGGDEFVVVLPACGAEDAACKADAIERDVMNVECEVEPGVMTPLRISVGTAVFPTDGQTLDELLAVADRRMFEHKNGRPDRVRRPGSAAGQAPSTALSAMARELQEQLLQAQKLAMIGQLTGGVAHDFNNALTAILGYSELLSLQIGPDKAIGRDLREIMNAAEHAAALTHQLLAFSRKQDVATAPVDLNGVVRNASTMLRRLLGERIQMTTELADGLEPVMANSTQLAQVLVNLAVNARDAMPDGGMLTVETSQEGDYSVLSVSDSGVGMTPDVKARLLEPFFTTKEPGRGTGLGLAVVSHVVSQAGGRIAIDSEPGCGATFRVYLPAIGYLSSTSNATASVAPAFSS